MGTAAPSNAGLHRLEAIKLLGHETIMTVVVELEDLEYEIAEIDENLIRSDISVVDQGDRFEHRQRIWEAIYPESGMGKAPKNNADRKNEIISFSDHAAEGLGLTPRSVQHLTKIGRLPDDIKDLVRGTPLGDHLVNLLKLARIKDPKEQRSGRPSAAVAPAPTRTPRDAHRRAALGREAGQ